MKVKTTGLFVLIFLCTFQWLGTCELLGQNPSSEPEIKLEKVWFNLKKDISNCNAIDIFKITKKGLKKIKNEWTRKRDEKGRRQHPAAYLKNKKISIMAKFSAQYPINDTQNHTVKIGAIAISADKNKEYLGNLKQKEVIFTYNGDLKKHYSERITFHVTNPAPNHLRYITQKWNWYLEGKEEEPFKSSTHIIYILLKEPVSPPWGPDGENKPWAMALDIACKWVDEERKGEGVMKKLTENLYNESGGKFSKEPNYAHSKGGGFDLFNFVRAMTKGDGIEDVNCFDMGKALVTFGNLLGCNAVYNEIKKVGHFKDCIPIGDSKISNEYFQTHAFAKFKEKIYDASLVKVIEQEPKPKTQYITGIDWEGEDLKKNKDGELKYKSDILVSSNKVEEPKDYDFEIERLSQTDSCFNRRWRKHVSRKYKLYGFYRNKYIYPEDDNAKVHSLMKEELAKLLDKPDFRINNIGYTYKIEINKNRDETPSKEKILKNPDWTYNKFNISEYSLDAKIINTCSKETVKQDKITMVIVEGQTMRSLKNFLLHYYANLKGLPKRKGLTPAPGHWHIKLELENDTTLYHFVRFNILTMLEVEKVKEHVKGNEDQFFGNLEEIDIIKLDNFLKSPKFKNNVGRNRKPASGKIKHLTITNSLKKKRKLIVQVYPHKTGQPCVYDPTIISTYYKINPSSYESEIFYKAGDIIRIFPGYVDGCSPIAFKFKFPKEKWIYNPRDAEGNIYKVFLHAPCGFNKPKRTIQKKDGNHQILNIEGGPPIWWIEIKVPKNLSRKKRGDKPKNVEVGEDDQDT